ncbi:hypothetical protein GGR56DRAFT_417536 [Xylariaceae sp. FL0804]|nr:hypothetical protein GGR56DRAFT_417536 [Xylariaceae sp. FL0804]
MAYRRSDDDLAYGERWDSDRFLYESSRNRSGIERDRFEERDITYGPLPTRERVREQSRPWDELRERETRYYEDPPRDVERRVVYHEREKDSYSPAAAPAAGRRPTTLLRRQSSLDTFDRRPPPRFYERDEYGPPARRGGADYDDLRRVPDPYAPIPLPRSRALPPPRVYAEREFDEEIRISEPERFGDDEYHPYPPERVLEREVTRTKRRRDGSASRVSRATSRSGRGAHTVRSSSKASASSSSSSSSSAGGTSVAAKSEYPKKGKTRVPVRLVSKRAIIDLEYPYVEEGNTIIIQKALGQQNIDDLLKLSEDYKKAEAEVAAARSSSGEIVEERREEIFTIPPPPASSHHPPPASSYHPPPAPPPEVIEKTTVIREISPPASSHHSHHHHGSSSRSSRSRSRSHSHYASTHRSHSTSTSTRTPLVVEAGPPRGEYVSEEVVTTGVGPLALVADRRRTDRDIKLEIARLEAERDLMRRDRHHSRHHHHSHSRHRSHSREMVRAERLPTGELVLYEEEVEKIEKPRRGVRIEKDKKGRMSISVPKNR